MVDGTPTIMYTRRADGERATTFVSPGVEAVLGYTRREYLSGPGFRRGILHPDDREAVRAERALKDASGEPFLMEYRVLSKDGRVVRVRDESVLVEDGEGLPPFWQGVLLDVTGRRRTERELEESERRLQELLAKLLGAQEEERRRVAYEVHDGLAQVAAAAHQHLQAFARRNAPEREEVRAELNLVVKLVRRTVTDARRIIANLRPTALDDFGLSAAVSLEVEKLREEGYEVEYFDGVGEGRLPDACEITLYRIAQESIANLQKHANAKRVKIDIRRLGDEARLEVRDWGAGFEPREVSAGSGPGARVGLAGMRERAGMLGGTLEVQSVPREGTAVVATIPIRP